MAVTGAMSADGRVLEVGGVRQKTAAARREGADLFIVPDAEYDVAKAAAGDMRVEKVGTLADALRVLSTTGGNALDLASRAR